MKSYLRKCAQAITIMDAMDALGDHLSGVLQGSVFELSDICFLYSMFPLSDTVRRYDVSYHSYAGDTQLCVALDQKDTSNVSDMVKSLECCIHNIGIWLLGNRQKIND